MRTGSDNPHHVPKRRRVNSAGNFNPPAIPSCEFVLNSDVESVPSDNHEASLQVREDGNADENNNMEMEIPFLPSSDPPTSWSPSSKILNWFMKVADVELKEAQMDSFLEEFVPSKENKPHFKPPRLPHVIWKKLKNDKDPAMPNLKNTYKSQSLISSAMMPLLTVLDSLDKEDPNLKLLAHAIEILCSCNLQLSRTRRSSVAKITKPELKPALLAHPVTHLHLFGEDFESSADSACKTQLSSLKVLAQSKYPKPPSANFQRPKPPSDTFQRPSQAVQPSTSNNSLEFSSSEESSSPVWKW